MTRQGIFAAVGAYLLWGVFPIYWKSIQHVPVFEILLHRVIWALLILSAILTFGKNWQWLKTCITSPATYLRMSAPGLLLATNWFIYIWAVNSGNIVESSLGYFINPLVNVLLGVFFLKERLRNGQKAAIAIALTGVLYLTFNYGHFPWIALSLAFSFGFYGLLRKTSPLNSTQGLTLEMSLMVIPALICLTYISWRGTAVFWTTDPASQALLLFAGVATAVPLLLFAYGARRITLTTLGVLQYIAPTMQLLLGIFLYNEAFPAERFIGFAMIWTSLLIYSLEGLFNERKLARA